MDNVYTNLSYPKGQEIWIINDNGDLYFYDNDVSYTFAMTRIILEYLEVGVKIRRGK